MIITIVRKPFEGGVAENISNHSCGGINISAIRVGSDVRTYRGMGNKVGNQENANGSSIYWMSKPPTTKDKREGASGNVIYEVEGRWPANVVISENVVKIMDKQSGVLKSGAMDSIAKGGQHTTYGKMYERRVVNPASVGGASRFFKVVKEND